MKTLRTREDNQALIDFYFPPMVWNKLVLNGINVTAGNCQWCAALVQQECWLTHAKYHSSGV